MRAQAVTSPITYDNLGRMLSANNGVTNSQAWDALGRLTSETGPLGTMSYQYDLAGRRTRQTWPDGFYVTNSWNLADGMTAVLHGGTTQIVGFAYDNLGRRTGISRSNGVSSTYGYDGAGRLISLSHDVGGTAADVTYTYAYNPAGQITSKTTSNDAYLWTPSVGGTAYTLNGLNQVTAAGATSLTYDANGNLTHDGTRAYAFDASNRLTGSGTATISYDALGRLDNYVGTSGARYLYDGVEAAGFATSGSTINTRFIRGPGVDEILASYTSTGSTPAQFWLSDERGSLVDTVNGSTGVSTAINTYDEYGNPGSGNVGRLQYTGQMWLPSFGAYHYKARAYTSGLGRFLQTDPIGYAAGANLYAYVGNDPINSIDPLGLFEDEPTDVDDVPAYGDRCPWYAVCLFDRESIERFLADVADLGEIVVTASLGHTQRERRGILPSTEYFQCFAAGTGGDGTILGNFLAAAGLALAGSPIIDKPRAGFGGGGPSGIKTTMISESVRSLPGMSLRAPSALRGAAAAVSRPGTRPRNYGASLGRIGSRGAGYLSLGLTTEGMGRVVGIAQQCNQQVGR